MTLPLEQELQDALHRDLWLLQQVMEAGPEGDPTDYIPPAYHYLPLLREALAKLTEAREAVKQEIPQSLAWKLGIEAKKHADSVETMARVEPEVRRFWLVDMLHFIVEKGIETLEAEGRPVRPIGSLRLSKVRRTP